MGLGKESHRHVFAGLSQPSHFVRELLVKSEASSSSVGNASHSSPKISIETDPRLLAVGEVGRKASSTYKNESEHRRPREIPRRVNVLKCRKKQDLTSLDRNRNFDGTRGLAKMKELLY
jgi:hypothetical protein